MRVASMSSWRIAVEIEVGDGARERDEVRDRLATLSRAVSRLARLMKCWPEDPGTPSGPAASVVLLT
jgi:hypothetical protein